MAAVISPIKHSLMDQTRQSRTSMANAARSAHSVAVDGLVFDAMKKCLAARNGHRVDVATCIEHGFPHFYWHHGIRQRIVNELNERGIPAPRGGKWTVKQVSRALLRCAARMGLA